MLEKELPKNYNPGDYEDAIYEKWEQSGFFNPDNLKGEPYAIMMPPPNVTGVLHLGHALENSLMDIMARYQRMSGKKVLLLPGTDHAAVATQAKVEKVLIAQGIKNPRLELGREKFLEKIREYSENSQSTILKQIRKMGTSCDWSRLAYTFDEARNRAVNEVFVKMYNDGLIYRGKRAVNWSVKGQSTCSDDELVNVERSAKLYTFKYAEDFPIAVASTQPETKLGDTAVAVNPKDKRYKKYIGKIFTVDIGAAKPLIIKIIADENVDQNFGTGAVGVTPAHSMVDFEMYEKQKAKGEPIDLIQVIGQNGKMTKAAGKDYAGLATLEARAKFVDWLKKEKLLEKEEDIMQNVGTSDRFGDVIEVLPMTQWFVDVNKKIPGRGESLKDLMRQAVTTGHNGDGKQKVKITPARFEKIYLDWINNLRDWCVSRQIWWGHRIPVWYRGAAAPGEQKKIGFHPSIVPELLGGKRRTYRLRDHDLKIGDRVIAEDSGSETTLGYLTITGVQKLTVGAIALPDMIHSGKYKTTPELIQAFKRMHPEKNDISEKTPAVIYDYDFSPLTKAEPENKVSITYFVHGATTDNEQKKRTGWHDGVLSGLGQKQNLELKETLRKRGDIFDVVFVSDLKRAEETAKTVFGDYKTDQRLRECNYGDLNGQPEEKFKEEKYYINNPHPNGESYKDVEKRIKEFLSEIAEKYRGKKIAIVSHMFPQLALEVILKNKTWEQAIDEDWRKKKGWQAGWKHEIEGQKNKKAKKQENNEQEIYVDVEAPSGKGWTQDEDTLDTWFSSGMWTFSTLGWPNKSPLPPFVKGGNNDLKTFHPTAWMQMGYEIIFLWLVRMVLMSTYALDQIPFKDVYMHGILRNEAGKKFSKSSGDNIDPLEIIKKYGTDALRLSVISGIAPGNDSKFYEEKVEGARNMVNKLWNISRYIITNYELRITNKKIKVEDLINTVSDDWIITSFNSMSSSVKEDLNSCRFSQASENLYEFTWNYFADWYLEISKLEKNKDDILFYILTRLIKLWHPFMPFVTEAIWQKIDNKSLLMVQKWPEYEEYEAKDNLDKNLGKPLFRGGNFEVVKDIVTAIRNARAENKVEPARKIKAVIYAGKKKKLIEEQAHLIKNLRTGLSELEVKDGSASAQVQGKGKKYKSPLPPFVKGGNGAIYAAVGEIEIYLIGAVDETKEKARLEKAIANLEKVIKATSGRLANKEFTAKAPAEIVKKEKAKLAGWLAELKKFKEQMGNL